MLPAAVSPTPFGTVSPTPSLRLSAPHPLPSRSQTKGQGPGCTPLSPPPLAHRVPGRVPGDQSGAGAGGPRTPNEGSGVARRQGAALSEAGGQGGAAGLAASKRELTAESPGGEKQGGTR